MARVAITIVTWNSMKYLPEALASVAKQTFRNFVPLIIDNASTDGVVEFVRANHPEAVILKNAKNRGFAHAQNQGIAYAKDKLAREGEDLFVLVTNPDVILEPDYLERIVDQVERRPEVGSAGGKLLKVYERGEDVLREGVRSNRIDSAGLRVYKSRRVVERGAGEDEEPERYERTEEVFGISGALALYRLSALEDVAYLGECFDEDFFAYKEDVDLAWRLRLRGWIALYVPGARAYHYRTAHGTERASVAEFLRNRKSRSTAVKRFSYKNHLLMLVKNEYFANALIDMPRIGWYEFKKMAYLLCLEPATFAAFGSFLRSLPRTLEKRRVSMSRSTASARDIRKWFM